ncbi:SDR family NAD(P)-dependent oxidoreductase [Hungatella hathewayi]
MEIKRYEGKAAIVTGAANGIGKCIVKRLLKEGANVAAFDIDAASLEAAYADTANVVTVTCDVSQKAEVEKAVKLTEEIFGKVDVLFCNAGIIKRGSLLDTTEEDWKKVIDVNLNGTFYLNQAVLKAMVAKGVKGAIVNTSSVASSVVSANTGAYSASKGGVSQLTKFAALEMAPYGIRVNAIGPGTSITRITEGTRFDKERNEKFLLNIPMGRYGEPEEAAAAALYLGSDDASYITGVTLIEDGGFSLF